MIGRQLNVTYCDDLRMESSGKALYIGGYFNDMLLPSFPYKINQLICAFSLRIPIDDDAKSFSVFLNVDDCTVQKLESIEIGSKKSLSQGVNVDDFPPVTEKNFRGVLRLQDLNVDKPSLISVYAIIDGDSDSKVLANKLRITSR